MILDILIVDDEKTICDGIVKMIHWEECGFAPPVTVYDGFAALAKMKENPFCALLTDVRLPEMSGLELCSIVQKQYPECKILIMSGYSEFEYARSAINLGALTYLLKPISVDELSDVLKRIAQERQSYEKNKILVSDKYYYMGKIPQSVALQETDLLKTDFSGFVTAISRIDENAAMQEITNFIQMLWENCIPEKTRLTLCYHFILGILHFIEEIGETTEIVFGDHFVLENYYVTSTILELHQKLNQLCRIVLDFLIGRKSKKASSDVVRVAEYIDHHCYESLTIMQLGELFYMNSTYLGRKFKSVIGMGIKQYSNECRIRHAKDLLVTTNKSVAAIAIFIGYSDFDYFCSLFKKNTNVTPVQYRLLYGMKNSEEHESLHKE